MDDRGSQMENDPNEDGKEELLDVVQITPDHIRANGTVHSTPFAGLAELVDNAVDSRAQSVHINYHFKNNGTGNYITVIDDGDGMTKYEMCNVIRIGKSNKKCDTGTIGQFGNGLKSGSMRLGETLLVITKQLHTYFNMLLISLRYLEDLGTQKCYVPMLSYEFAEDPPNPLEARFEPGEEEKHNKSMDVFLRYTPFSTEQELLEFMTSAIEGANGTCILVSDLKRYDNNELELTPDEFKKDLLINKREVKEDKEMKKKKIKKPEEEKGKEPDENKQSKYLSHYLSDLYIMPTLSIFINGHKVNQRDPIKSLADPRWMPLTRAGLECFNEREKKALAKEKDRLIEQMLKRREKYRALHNQIKARDNNLGPEDVKRIRKEMRILNDEIDEYQKAEVKISNRKSTDGFDGVRMNFGIDLMRRCDTRVVFYTNGRRIMSVPLAKKGYKFHRFMGVVCIIDIPSTLLATAQNREHYETPAEVNLIMQKIITAAATYFEHADEKYKSDAFWMKLGYLANGLPYDIADPTKERECLEVTGLRKFCLNCRLFREVEIDKFEDPSTHTFQNAFDLRPFRCNIDQLKNRSDEEVLIYVEGECLDKQRDQLEEEEVKRISYLTPRTYYSPLEAIPCERKQEKKFERAEEPTRASGRIQNNQAASANNDRPGPSRRRSPSASPPRPAKKNTHQTRSSSSQSSDAPPPPPKRTAATGRVAKPFVTKSSSDSDDSPSPPPKKAKAMNAREKARLKMDEERRRVLAMAEEPQVIKKAQKRQSAPLFRRDYSEEVEEIPFSQQLGMGVPKEEEEPTPRQLRSAMQPKRGRGGRAREEFAYQEEVSEEGQGDERPPSTDDEEEEDGMGGMQRGRRHQRRSDQDMEVHRALLESMALTQGSVGMINTTMELLNKQRQETKDLKKSYEDRLRHVERSIKMIAGMIPAPEKRRSASTDALVREFKQLAASEDPIGDLERITQDN